MWSIIPCKEGIYLFFWFTLQLLELEVEIERNKTTLKSLQDLDHMYRW